MVWVISSYKLYNPLELSLVHNTLPSKLTASSSGSIKKDKQTQYASSVIFHPPARCLPFPWHVFPPFLVTFSEMWSWQSPPVLATKAFLMQTSAKITKTSKDLVKAKCHKKLEHQGCQKKTSTTKKKSSPMAKGLFSTCLMLHGRIF